jgi:autotransporter-associated beta strand protein
MIMKKGILWLGLMLGMMLGRGLWGGRQIRLPKVCLIHRISLVLQFQIQPFRQEYKAGQFLDFLVPHIQLLRQMAIKHLLADCVKAYIHRSYNLIYHPANHKTVQPMLMMHTSTRSATARAADAVQAYVNTIAKGLMLCLLIGVAVGQGWGQNQVIGTFPAMEGGFDGTTAGTLGTTLSSTVWTRQSQANTTASVTATGGRSSGPYATVNSNSSTATRVLQSPQQAATAANTAYRIQFYYKSSANATNFQSGVSTNGTSSPTYTTAATLNSTSGVWTKYEATVTTPGTTVTSNGIGIVRFSNTGGNVDVDIDDFVIYAGSAVDNSAPNSPGTVTVSNPTTSSLDVSWGVASGGVDGGGYVVVRYAVNPNADNDPNQNGIYAVGNTHTNGTGSLTGTIRYIGTGTSFTDNNGLNEGTQYWYKVYTVDKAFNYSAESQGTGTTSSAGTPSIAISTAHPASTDISQVSTNNILASYQLNVTTATATLNSISVTTAGTYASADIASNGFKFWINSANNLSGATQLGSSQPAVGSGGTVAVTGLSQSVPVATRYILVTADIALGATVSNTISLASTAFSNIVFASGTKTGTDPAAASNAMTIIACTPTNVTGLSLTPGNTQISVSWTNPSCLDEVMIVAKASSSITASPSGDGSAYTANLAFGSGTAFDGGFVVYKGSTSPQTIIGLTNGTTYFVKVFTRRGTVWSSGVENSASPSITAYYWNGGSISTNPANGGTGTWTTTNAWRQPSASGSQATWADGNNAILAGTAGDVTIGSTTVAPTMTYVNVTGYTIQTDASTTTRSHNGPITLESGVNLKLMNATATADRALNIGGNITGGAGSSLTIQGNQGTGASRINLSVSEASISVPVTISAGGTGGGHAGFVATASNTQLTATATITNNSTLSTMIGATSGNSLTVNGVISGSENLQFSAGPSGGGGTVTLNAANNYTGATIFNAASGGVMRLGITNALPTGTNVTMANSSGNGGIFDLNGFDQTIASLTSGIGVGSIRNNGSVDATLTINGSTSPAAFGLTITDGTTNKVLLIRSGTGTTELTGACTYTGLTTVSGGTLILNRSGGGTLPSTNNVTVDGGTLRISTNQTIKDLTISSGTLTIDGGVTLTITGSYSVSGGTINNQGTIKLNGGAVSFPGSGVTVNNGTANTMSNLEIATSGNVTVTGPFTVNGTLTLTNGKLTLGSNTLTIGSSGSISGPTFGAASSNYIVADGGGALRCNAGTDVLYPIGTSTTYLPCQLTGGTGPFDVKLVSVSSGLSNSSLATSSQWDITNGSGSPTMAFQWSSPVITAPAYLFKHNGSSWANVGSSSISGSGPYTASFSGVSCCSGFVVGALGALPIELVNFKANPLNKEVLLTWRTASERNNSHFSIEKSTDGQRFQAIGQVSGKGTTYEMTDYRFTDTAPAAGLNYYRLKQVDFDGGYSYSPIVSVRFGKVPVIQVYPNPAREEITLLLPEDAGEESLIQLFDQHGRLVKTFISDINIPETKLNIRDLPAGSYVLKVQTGRAFESRRVVVVRG